MMNYYKYILLSLSCLSFCQCSGIDEDAVWNKREEIEGEYKCCYIEWKGPAVDIDGDGIARTDIYSEMPSIRLDNIKAKLRTSESRNCHLNVEAPVPATSFNPRDSTFNNDPYLNLYHSTRLEFRITKKGEVNFEGIKGPEINLANFDKRDASMLGGLEVLRLENDHLVIQMDCRLYDCSLKDFIVGKFYEEFIWVRALG